MASARDANSVWIGKFFDKRPSLRPCTVTTELAWRVRQEI